MARSVPRKSKVAPDAGPALEVVPASSGSAPVSSPSVAAATPALPFAKWIGELDLVGEMVEVYVLSDGRRLMSLRGVVRSLTGADNGRLDRYIGVGTLKPFVDADTIMRSLVEFSIPGTPNSRGVSTAQFLAIITGYVAAMTQGAELTDRQFEIAKRCAAMALAFMNVGVDAAIDEVTGYQRERADDAIQVKLKAFISETLRGWTKTFPDQLWIEFGRLSGWKDPLRNRPLFWGKLVVWLIYDTLDADVAKYLKENKPPPNAMWHQQLTAEVGVPKLVARCFEVIGVAKSCSSIADLCEKVEEYYGQKVFQYSMAGFIDVPRDESRKRRRNRPATIEGEVVRIDRAAQEKAAEEAEQLDLVSQIGEVMYDFAQEAAMTDDAAAEPSAHEKFANGRRKVFE